ncbi:MAG: sugar ABC transporter substrate-binding protein [Candidatus Limnocylindrales bacterium]
MSLHISGSNGTRLAGLLASFAIVVAACGGGGATSAPVSQAPASQAPSSEAPASSAPASMAAEKFKIGYISLGDSVPFVKLVSDGIKKAATAAGQDLAFCDSEIDAAKALACAQNLKVQGVQGVLNFQVFQDSSKEVCAAYDNLPTIAIDIIQPPCQIAFMGANNKAAGKMGGEAIGKYAKDNWNCDITAYVSLESTAAGSANTDRMGGWREGFKEFCPIPAEKERILDGADRTDPALEQVTNLLGALPGNHIVVVAINEDGILGAIGAANTLGRQKDLYYGGQGTDPSIWKDVACNPNYIASVAYFPERYGDLLIPNMVKKLQGETIPENIFTEHVVVNKDNIRTIYPETPAC